MILQDRVADLMFADTAESLERGLDFRTGIEDVRGNIAEWGRRLFPHYFTKPFSPMHRAFGRAMDGWKTKRNARGVGIGPRGNAKSTFFTFLYPINGALEAFEPYQIVTADSEQQAKKYLAGIKHELEHNEELARFYPDAVGRGRIWNDLQIVTRNGCCIEALGSGTKIRGRRHGAVRPSAILIDDPDGDEAVYSPTIRARTWDWITKSVLEAGAPGTNVFAAGTRLHRECAVSQLANMPGWECLEFRSIISWPVRMDLWESWQRIFGEASNPHREYDARQYYEINRAAMDQGASVLWPEHESLYELMCKRAIMGRWAFESEKQNNPVDPSTVEWPPSLFEGDIWFDEWPDNKLIEAKIVALDPSKGRTDKPGDYQARVSVAKVGQLYYVDADLQRHGISQMLEDMIRWNALWQPDAAGIESVQFQELLIGDYMQVSKALDLPAVPPYPIEHGSTPKVVRIRRLNPYINLRAFRFKRRSPGVQLLLQQLMDFPNGSHDDGPDALEMCMRMMDQICAPMPDTSDSIDFPVMQ